MASTPPSIASSVGYNTETFGPNVALGGNWYKANFFGINPNAVNATQNGDGSVTIAGGGDGYNEQLSTAQATSTGWKGAAFGGGAYMQATLSWTGGYSGSGGWPSFWSNDIEHMSGTTSTQWQGQPAGYDNWIEPDFVEYWANNRYGSALHNWYGSGKGVSTNIPQVTLPAGTDVSQPHTYGFLWVPATNTAQGYAKFFLDGKQVSQTVTWNKYDPSAPPPPADGSSAYSVLDSRHLAMILGTGPNNPMKVSDVQVWQASTAGDIFNGVPTPPTPPPVPPPAPPPGGVINVPSWQTSVTVSVSNETINATGGNHIFFITGHEDTLNLSGGSDTVRDWGGGGNKFVLPKAGNGSVSFDSTAVGKQDVFDLTAALKGTSWDGSAGTINHYLHAVQSGGNTNLLVSWWSSSQPYGTTVATFTGQTLSLSTILSHSIT